MVKPNSLIEIKEHHKLTAGDRKVYNILIKDAWESILEDKVHKVQKQVLKGNHHGNDRLSDTIVRLQKFLVQIDLGDSIARMPLISFTLENKRDDGFLYYEFDKRLRNIIASSKYFTRLEYESLNAIKSKYGLILYELIAKKANMRNKRAKMSLADIRDLLGVAPDKYKQYSELRKRVLDRAVEEVNSKSPFTVKYSPIKTGRKITGILLQWQVGKVRKQIEKEEDYGEFGVPKRIVDLRNSRLQDKMFIVPQQTINKLGKLGVDMDLYNLEEEFYGANQGKKIRNVSKAFQGFFDFRRQQVLF